jgi:hypothetical protein
MEQNQVQRRIGVEPGDQVHGLQRSGDRRAIFEDVDGPFIVFAQATHGGIGVERKKQAGAERAPCAR